MELFADYVTDVDSRNNHEHSKTLTTAVNYYQNKMNPYKLNKCTQVMILKLCGSKGL